MQIDAQHRALAAQPEVPLLRFQPALGIPIWAFGVSCGLLVFALLMVPVWLVPGEKALQIDSGSTLFLAVNCMEWYRRRQSKPPSQGRGSSDH